MEGFGTSPNLSVHDVDPQRSRCCLRGERATRAATFLKIPKSDGSGESINSSSEAWSGGDSMYCAIARASSKRRRCVGSKSAAATRITMRRKSLSTRSIPSIAWSKSSTASSRSVVAMAACQRATCNAECGASTLRRASDASTQRAKARTARSPQSSSNWLADVTRASSLQYQAAQATARAALTMRDVTPPACTEYSASSLSLSSSSHSPRKRAFSMAMAERSVSKRRWRAPATASAWSTKPSDCAKHPFSRPR